jgi:16S rRNA (cytosine1402-N4)-methyltransferase
MSELFYHAPVLLEEVLNLIPHKRDGVYLDATLGGGGHFRAMADRLDEHGVMIGLDRDGEAIAWTRDRLGPMRSRFILEQARFSEFDQVLLRHGIPLLDGILIDLGVSSRQIDAPARGFSYQRNGALDMRMDPSQGISAHELIRNSTVDELADILRNFGEVRRPGRIAAAIKEAGMRHAAMTSMDLRECCARVAGEPMPIALLAKIFQALRIAVNDELGELKRFLSKVLLVLRAGGRLVVISYHSLEDRLVKEYIREQERSCICPPELPQCRCDRTPLFKRITKKAIRPSAAELALNRRSRSARLRAAERTEASR